MVEWEEWWCSQRRRDTAGRAQSRWVERVVGVLEAVTEAMHPNEQVE